MPSLIRPKLMRVRRGKHKLGQGRRPPKGIRKHRRIALAFQRRQERFKFAEKQSAESKAKFAELNAGIKRAVEEAEKERRVTDARQRMQQELKRFKNEIERNLDMLSSSKLLVEFEQHVNTTAPYYERHRIIAPFEEEYEHTGRLSSATIREIKDTLINARLQAYEKQLERQFRI